MTGHARPAHVDAVAREALASLGLLSPGAIEDDITTLLPLVHPAWRWRELAGADGVAAMIEAGILEEVPPDESRRPAQKTVRHLGRSAIAFRLYRPIGPAPVRTGVLAHRLHGVGERAREVLLHLRGFGRAVVLVPKGRALGLDSVEIELTVPEQLGAASWRVRVPEAVRALGIEDRVAPELLAPGDARLVVDTRRERVLFDRVTLVTIGDSGYRLLRVLAEQGGGGAVVATAATDKAVSSAREGEGATRKAAWKMRGWLESSFAQAGKELPGERGSNHGRCYPCSHECCGTKGCARFVGSARVPRRLGRDGRPRRPLLGPHPGRRAGRGGLAAELRDVRHRGTGSS